MHNVIVKTYEKLVLDASRQVKMHPLHIMG